MPNFFDKVKSGAKQFADQSGKAARSAKLKMNVVSLNSEKNKHLQTIGLRVYSLYKENSAIDGNVLKDKVKDEISQISRIDEKIRELESEISELQSGTQNVDVTDVTEDESEK
ncbi:MAG: hypothetical protein K2Z81_21850 [Cyanobacteria bacterium]|nr:hypothetical protein [Cyanobacteriota bacterium]